VTRGLGVGGAAEPPASSGGIRSTVTVRAAREDDAGRMADILNTVIAIGGTTAHTEPFDEKRIRAAFIAPTRGISCFVAVVDHDVVGFQALEWSDPEWTGDHPLPADWAFISTYVSPSHHRRGIGHALFAHTADAARRAGVRFVDATIRAENRGGLAFYEAIGFTEYRRDAHSVSKRFAPSPVRRHRFAARAPRDHREGDHDDSAQVQDPVGDPEHRRRPVDDTTDLERDEEVRSEQQARADAR